MGGRENKDDTAANNKDKDAANNGGIGGGGLVVEKTKLETMQSETLLKPPVSLSSIAPEDKELLGVISQVQSEVSSLATVEEQIKALAMLVSNN